MSHHNMACRKEQHVLNDVQTDGEQEGRGREI